MSLVMAVRTKPVAIVIIALGFLALWMLLAYSRSYASPDLSINSCGPLAVPGETYLLTQDVNSTGTCFSVNADNITLDCAGHTVTGDGTGLAAGMGVQVTGRSGITIKNCVLSNYDNGIDLFESDNTTIRQNTSHSNHSSGSSRHGNGVFVTGFANTIQGNAFFSNGSGIVLHGPSSAQNRIEDNLVHDNLQDGIWVVKSGEQNVISRNEVFANRFGIELNGSFQTAADNIISNNELWGLRIGGTDHIISGNELSGSQDGILLNTSATRNTFVGNRIHANWSTGIVIGTGGPQVSAGNLIYNNFFDNSVNARDILGSNTWNIAKTPGTNIVGGPFLGGNFWSDYTGNDLDADGLGDTLLPHTSAGPILNGGDFRPLVCPTCPPPPGPVGVDVRRIDPAGLPLETWNSSGPGAASLWIAVGATAALVTLSGVAWYTRRRSLR